MLLLKGGRLLGLVDGLTDQLQRLFPKCGFNSLQSWASESRVSFMGFGLTGTRSP